MKYSYYAGIVAIAWLIPGLAAAAPCSNLESEPLGQSRFAGTLVNVYQNTDTCTPGPFDKKLPVKGLTLSAVRFLKWDDKKKMMLVDFGQDVIGWVTKRDLIPPATACEIKSAANEPYQGGNTKNQVLAGRGLIEKACK